MTWECGVELDGRRCSRPVGHKGMHRKRSMLGPSREALRAAYEAGIAAARAVVVGAGGMEYGTNDDGVRYLNGEFINRWVALKKIDSLPSSVSDSMSSDEPPSVSHE